ncbi:hypothetical protein RND81_06G117200 [Saponaria officinalis]|uniref:DUF4408 domain-containing protein n=1 Tax=Saponaria officinalis TaxID=3572 RepID=A0AAW1KA60_SAPOF
MITIKNSFIMSIKIILISTAILLLSTTLPRLLAAASSELPAILTAVKSWLRPPYLYFIINGIIITIVASSRLHHAHHHAPLPESEAHAPAVQNVILVRDVGVVEVEEVKEVVTSLVRKTFFEDEVVATVEEGAEFGWGPPPDVPRPLLVRQEAVAGFFSERPPAASRFGHHRRPAKTRLAEGIPLFTYVVMFVTYSVFFVIFLFCNIFKEIILHPSRSIVMYY